VLRRDPDAPRLHGVPFLGAHEHGAGRFIDRRARFAVAAFGNVAVDIDRIAALNAARSQSETRAEVLDLAKRVGCVRRTSFSMSRSLRFSVRRCVSSNRSRSLSTLFT
jgi:hypothetical protein